MKAEDPKLYDLVNNDSFIRWVENTASESERKRWDEWLLKSDNNRKKFLKAQKLLNMPFISAEAEYDVYKELKKLHARIIRSNTKDPSDECTRE